MSIRLELQKKLTDWAKAQSPIIPVSIENIPFVKPANGPYLQIIFLSSSVVNPFLDGTYQRETGIMQVNVCVPEGIGTKVESDIANSIRNLFPVIPKTGAVSIERPAQVSMAIVRDDGFRVIPVSISYRQERF